MSSPASSASAPLDPPMRRSGLLEEVHHVLIFRLACQHQHLYKPSSRYPRFVAASNENDEFLAAINDDFTRATGWIYSGMPEQLGRQEKHGVTTSKVVALGAAPRTTQHCQTQLERGSRSWMRRSRRMSSRRSGGRRSQMVLLSVNVRSPKRMLNTMGQTRT